MIDWTWGITITSLVGSWANVKQKSWGFIVWMGTNAAWCGIDFYQGIYSQAFLMLVYFVMAAWGYYEWTKANA